ncbi:cytochrome oxidase, partial [Oleiphilus sp. HI0043]|uniref:cbb3-type cytochrome oxidase assembly protein CcoS n=2 Tax=Oleiphilus TaxID=141450 RepID=UPI0007C2B032
FGWAVKNGQYDDLEGPAHSILYDDDKDMIPGQNNKTQKKDLNTKDSQHSEKSDD